MKTARIVGAGLPLLYFVALLALPWVLAADGRRHTAGTVAKDEAALEHGALLQGWHDVGEDHAA
ncbi:hypothetical protein GCM10020367_21260 [Streptomyces sannanensis]|uniref:Uncharacterized protein n=1 Tax=Streptomyces sannanensis TaxID=285536 RepID=A0ABP6S9D2_9ACTN